DEVATANRLVPKILGEADIVVAVVHMGIYDDPTIGAPALAANVPGLALVVSGHSHTMPDEYVIVTNKKTGAKVPVVQAHQWGRYVGQVILRFRNGEITNFSIDPISINHKERVTLDGGDRVIRPVGPQFAEDPQLLAKLVPFREQVAEVMEKVIGTAAGVFDQAIVRDQESAIGNAVADSMYWYADKFQLKPDFAFQNGGGVRADLPEGTITIGDVYQAIPFDNSVVTVTMSGRDVIKLFESTPEKVTHGAMPQVSKQVSFTIDTGTGTIANLKIGGKPVDPNGRYVVVTNSYLAEGGDGYDAFKNSFALYDTSAMQRDALMDYIREGLNGRLVLETDGRMIVK
ncbi:MAG: 5'-nucleotidase C-terminal domain-containing protein, partial [Alkalispirochaeta sp.]